MHCWGQNMKYLRNQTYTHCASSRPLHHLKLLILNRRRKQGHCWGENRSRRLGCFFCTFFIHCTWKHKGVDKMKLSKNLQDTDPVQWQYLPRYVVYIHSLWTQTADVTVVALQLPGEQTKLETEKQLPKVSGIFLNMYIFFKTSQILFFSF